MACEGLGVFHMVSQITSKQLRELLRSLNNLKPTGDSLEIN
jgi:hypothetical protein